MTSQVPQNEEDWEEKQKKIDEAQPLTEEEVQEKEQLLQKVCDVIMTIVDNTRKYFFL